LAAAGIALIVAAWQGCTLLPSHRTTDPPGFATSSAVFWRVIVPALVWAWLVPFTIEFALARRIGAAVGWRPSVEWLIPFVYTYGMLLGYWIAWARHADVAEGGRVLYKRNHWRWLAAVLCSAGLIWIGLHLVLSLTDPHFNFEVYRDQDTHPDIYHWAREHLFDYEHRLLVDAETTLALLFPLWLIVVHLLQTTFYVGFRKEGLLADLDREWLARLSGIVLRLGVA
jgi:hypothetical protein